MKKSAIENKFLRTVTPEDEPKQPTCISLFSGCGGMDLGFRQAGFEVRVMVEWDKKACETLRCNWTKEGVERNFGGKKPDWFQEREPAILERDITTLSTEEILIAAGLEVGEATCVTGGFPCQGFSLANGKRTIDDPRNRLYKECVRIIREALPRTFCFENVPGLAQMANGQVIKQICEDLAESGYNLTWDILDAADYGVPQRRRRIIFVGNRVDLMRTDFDKPNENPKLYMGAFTGEIKYPDWFKAKYRDLFQLTLV